MNLGPNYVDAYLLADQAICSVLSEDRPGAIVSVDIGGSLFDCIASHCASLFGHRFASFPTLLRYRSGHTRESQPANAADVLSVPRLLGRSDAIMRIADDREALNGYGPRQLETATCTIDSWRGSQTTVRMIHFGDQYLIDDQIAGAAETLAQDGPVLTLYPAGADRAHLLDRLKDLDYKAIDLSGNAVSTDKNDDQAEIGWIAVPSTKYEALLSTISLAPRSQGDDFSAWQQMMLNNAPKRQQRSRSLFGLPANVPQLFRTFSAEEIIATDNCYFVETDGRISWRWLGPRPRTRIAIPCPLPGIYRGDVSVLATHLRGGLEDCRVLIDGREVKATIHGLERGMVRFFGRLEPEEYIGHMTVDIVSAGQVLSVNSDPRTLRLNIQSIAMSPWH